MIMITNMCMKVLSRLLATADVNPNEVDHLGSAPLHCLAKRDIKKSKRALDLLYTFLTESDVLVNLPDDSKNTALHHAVKVHTYMISNACCMHDSIEC